jgi:hypothetical protein
MPTHSSKFQKAIQKALRRKSTLKIEEIYEVVSRNVKLNESDFEFTTVKGRNTTEPVWKRNVRNVLQSLKNRGLLVNSPKHYWRKPTPNLQILLPEDKAWQLVIDKARIAFLKNDTWTSPIEQNRYQIESINDEKIVIRRLDANKSDSISMLDVTRAIKYLNAAGGRVSRGTVNNTVAKETAIVQFHPSLKWDDNFTTIVIENSDIPLVQSIQVKPTKKQIKEALNDDPNAFQKTARRIRKGQPKFRKLLLEAYNSKCCISGTGPSNVLQAAHIEPHSVSGENLSANGLLLRSDLHDLFDDNMLAIHPQSFKIYIHPSLNNTIYWQLNSRTLIPRNDGQFPSMKNLKSRWAKIKWLKQQVFDSM